MKAKQLITLFLAGLLVTAVWAQPPKMKMTTDIPASITAPDRVMQVLKSGTLAGTREAFLSQAQGCA